MGLDDRLLEGKPQNLVEAARDVAAAVEGSGADLASAVKWGKATYAVDGDFHHWLCAIGVTKRVVTLTFHFGGILEDPDALLIAGTSKLLRRLEYREASEVDDEVIARFMELAVAAYPYFKEHWRELT